MSLKVTREAESTVFRIILDPLLTLFRCLGLELHESSATARSCLRRTLHLLWIGFTLSSCLYHLAVEIPSQVFGFGETQITKTGVENTGVFHSVIESLNYWVYNLAVFTGAWWLTKTSVVGELWKAINDLLVNVPLSGDNIGRCRRMAIQCTIGVSFLLFINITANIAAKYQAGFTAIELALELLKLVYVYSFASSALFVVTGRIVTLSFDTIAQQLQLQCTPAPTDPTDVWKYQRQFGIACRAADEFCNAFGFIIFTTVSHIFIGFVNASYDLLKLYQRLPQAIESGDLAPQTIRMTYNMIEHMVRLWMICHTADLIRSKALSLVPVLQTIRNELYARRVSGDESEEVHAFLLEVSETSPTFEVLGLFTLTKQVIISLAGTTLTYLVVLCQFSSAEAKPPSPNDQVTTAPSSPSTPAMNNT